MDIQNLDDNWGTPRDLGNLHVTYPIHPRMTFHARRASPNAAPATQEISHNLPHLPRNLHIVTTWRSPDNAIRKKHATRHV